MEKTEKILLLGMAGLILIGIITVFSTSTGSQDVSPEEGQSGQSGQSFPFDTKIDEGRVTVELTPVKFEDGKIYFEIKLNTHSVELSQFNLTELTSLEFKGKELKPISAPGIGSHHSSGVIIFDTGSNKNAPDRFTVKIRNLDSDERVFTWP